MPLQVPVTLGASLAATPTCARWAARWRRGGGYVALALLAAVVTACGGGDSGSSPTPLGSAATLSYPANPYGYIVGSSIAIVPESATGLSSFTADSLPHGLSIDGTSGKIYGHAPALPSGAPPLPYRFDVTVVAHDGNGAVRSNLQIWVMPQPAASYSVGANLQSQTKDFYNAELNWPTYQDPYGFCETASTSSLIGYARWRNTNKVSVLYTLFQAYDSPNPNFTTTGTTTGTIDPFYLWRTPKLGNLWDFLRDQGYVMFQGTPPDSQQSQQVFMSLAQAATPKGESLVKDPTVLPGLKVWSDLHDQYIKDRKSGAAVAATVNLHDEKRALNTFTKYGTRLSDRIAEALDSGYLVHFMFNVLVYSQADDAGIYYSYNPADATLQPGTPPTGHFNNVWSLGRPLIPSVTDQHHKWGMHYVYFFSYATASDGARIFFIRNSWGSANGENGNYYMADNAVDGQFVDPSSGKVVDVITETRWALPIHPM